MVNAIPETVRMESYVRGASFDAILSANRRVNRALVGAALSLGANVEIIDFPGYAPHDNDLGMGDLAQEVFKEILPDKPFSRDTTRSSGSTDMGDLSRIMPVLHPYAPGATGTAHGNNYYITDPFLACVDSAKWQVGLLFRLLENGGEQAKQIVEGFEPQFASVEDFLSYMDNINCRGDRIIYNEDGTATVRL